MKDSSEKIRVGVIGRAHGVQGAIRVCTENDSLLRVKKVYLGEEHDMVVKGSQHYIRITVNTTEDVKLVNFRAKMVSDARKAEATRVKEKWVAQKENR